MSYVIKNRLFSLQNFLFFCKIVCNSSFSLDNSSLFALRLVAFLQMKVATWLMRILQGM